jgi:hypothetical protein
MSIQQISGINAFMGWVKTQKIGKTLKIVIGHGIGGKIIPAKMVQLAESQSLE